MKSVRGEIPIKSLYTSGLAGEKFFSVLKEGKLVATQCKKCNLIYCPARLFCESCFNKLDDYVTLPGTGILSSFTKCSYDLDARELKEPFLIGLVRLDGASTSFVHRLNVKKPTVGMRVRIVFEKERKGSILDIKFFEEV